MQLKTTVFFVDCLNFGEHTKSIVDHVTSNVQCISLTLSLYVNLMNNILPHCNVILSCFNTFSFRKEAKVFLN